MMQETPTTEMARVLFRGATLALLSASVLFGLLPWLLTSHFGWLVW